jgi:hypothetical protein
MLGVIDVWDASIGRSRTQRHEWFWSESRIPLKAGRPMLPPRLGAA